LLERVIIAGRDIWFYLGKLLWPHPLVFIYPQWETNTSQVLQYVPLLAAIAGLIFLWWKRQDALRPVFFAAAYFIISLFPVLGFFDVYFFRYSFVGDHFQYLASIGPLVLVGSAINSWFDAFVKQPRFLKPVGCAGLLCLLGVLSWQQSKTYRDQETLWRTTLQKNPNSWMVRNSVAVILLEQGRIADAMEQLKLVSKPDNPVTQGSLGAALLKMGQLDAAYLHLRRAIELEPTFVAAYVNMGSLLLQNGQAEESHRFLEQALRINPDFVAARSNLANTLLSLGRPNEALYHLQKALESAPYDSEAQKNMAWIMATSPDSRIRNGAKAVELAERANQLTDGRNPLMLIILAAAYAEAGRFSEALSTAERAVQAANDSGDVALAHAARAHIAHYRSGQPVRDVR
jgi:tetratricopeptide (TPR) repeat protein